MTGEKSLVGWLKAEASFIFLATLALYAWTGASWWLFLLLFLAPDLSMFGYLAGPRTGALVYNLGHAYIGPVLLMVLGLCLDRFGQSPAAFQKISPIAVIWASHIAFDRVLGYGLKSPEGFKITHLGRIGRQDS
ncbi:DUF4260 domain-containing protein [Roseibium sp.]|uniref:DUF4260 domain-containing protein n=1 Tax=Roseibium sp. TaxID=1936156 RepID=UPI003D09F81D